MKNIPDPGRPNDPDPAGTPGRNLPEVQESRGHVRWLPPVIAIVVLVVVLVILGVYYL